MPSYQSPKSLGIEIRCRGIELLFERGIVRLIEQQTLQMKHGREMLLLRFNERRLLGVVRPTISDIGEWPSPLCRMKRVIENERTASNLGKESTIRRTG